MARRLAVNADDFGFTRDVNEGIVHAHRAGILTSTTLMANAPAFEHAVALSREAPSLDIGVHFVLVGGPGQPESVAQLISALALRRLDVDRELRGQIDKILTAGIEPTHLDTHKHTHLHPVVLDAVARLSAEYRVPWVRRPFDFPLHGAPSEAPWLKRATSHALRAVRARFHRKLAEHGCKTTDYFAGFELTGRFRTREVVHLLRSLPEGSTEFMVHPGFCREELAASRTRLKHSREEELRALVDPEVMRTIEAEGIQLTPFSRL